jgi:hypothetical protein
MFRRGSQSSVDAWGSLAPENLVQVSLEARSSVEGTFPGQCLTSPDLQSASWHGQQRTSPFRESEHEHLTILLEHACGRVNVGQISWRTKVCLFGPFRQTVPKLSFFNLFRSKLLPGSSPRNHRTKALALSCFRPYSKFILGNHSRLTLRSRSEILKNL